MRTKRYFEEDIAEAAQLIQDGEIVAFPTDTVYGLGADAGNEAAVRKIFKAKGRPDDRALTVLIADKQAIHKYAIDIPEEALLLAEKFWPGALTIVLNKQNNLATSVTGQLNTVGLRMPNNSLALRFIEECGVPLAAPSANLTGRPSPTTADHVLEDLDGKISGVIDGGESPDGIESTVLDLSNPEKPLILRPGGVTQAEIEERIGKQVLTLKQTFEKEKQNKHYEPTIPLYIVESAWSDAIQQMLQKEEKIGLLANEEIISQYEDQVSEVYSLGKKDDRTLANKHFFKALRVLEQSSATVILAEGGTSQEFSEAYINRLLKAANGKVI